MARGAERRARRTAFETYGSNDQFAIGSVTKPVVAAQVMQMVEAGEIGLDDLAAGHLPPDLDFDSNDATIRHLLGQRSGIPDYY